MITYWINRIKYLLLGGDIKNKAVRGSAALCAGSVFQRMLRLGRTMILARLLVPDDFGVIAVTMMVAVMLESITDAGVRLSIIQNKEGTNPSFLNVAWWFQTIRGIGLFFISFLLAPYIAVFYENPILTDLLRVSFLSILFNGLVSPRVHLLEREFKFWKWTLLEQVSSLIGTLVTIVLAYYYRSVWAIVLGTVVERLLYFLISHILYPFFPKFEFDKNSMSELFKFSSGIFGLSAMNLIARQADVFVLGKVVTPAILGSYYLAQQLAEQPLNLFSSIIVPVLLPSYSALKDNESNMKNALLSLNHVVATLGIPIVVFLAVNSFVLLSIFYGGQYTNSGIPLAFLFLGVFARVQTTVLSQIYYGLGLPHLHRLQCLKRSALIVGLIYPAVLFSGTIGAALVLLLANTSLLIFQLYNFKGILNLKPVAYLSKWIIGVGLGLLILIPNGVMLLFKVDSLLLKISFAVVTMTIIMVFGLYKLLQPAVAIPGKHAKG